MKGVIDFNEFLKKGIVKKQSPDKSRSKFIKKESEMSFEGLLERIDKIGVNPRNSNSIIKDCYDIIFELIRSKMILKGYNSSGFGAHEAEVSYLRVLNFSEKEIQFLNQLRYFRNGMIYYGKVFDEDYAKDVFNFTKKVIRKINNI
ncbi:MAG: hypothetical protein NUV46_03485 [Nanoarchaeota archaeon]|nr:hypothetical protein [Nanoarchaeota archaeon]